MIVNGNALLDAVPIKNMLTEKVAFNGVSHGLAEVGYDIRIKQDVAFMPHNGGIGKPVVKVYQDEATYSIGYGHFALASSIEEFDMPRNLMGVVHDKSTWARRGLSVFNTVIEPGWKGFLTLELVYHGSDDLHIPSGSGIAQVIFHRPMEIAAYEGKYQDQPDRPVSSIMEPN